MRPAKAKAQANGLLSYGNESMPIYVTSISYSWSLEASSAQVAQTRNRQTTYPFRARQSPLSVSFSFMSVQDYIDFVEFIGRYHRACVADGVATFPYMRFTCDGVGSKGCDYIVLPETSQLSISSGLSAPKVANMSFKVVRDMLDWWVEQRSSSYLTSTEIVPAERRVTPQNISEGAGRDEPFRSAVASRPSRRHLENRYTV